MNFTVYCSQFREALEKRKLRGAGQGSPETTSQSTEPGKGLWTTQMLKSIFCLVSLAASSYSQNWLPIIMIMMTRPHFLITTVDAISATIMPLCETTYCRQPRETLGKRKLWGAGQGSPETAVDATEPGKALWHPLLRNTRLLPTLLMTLHPLETRTRRPFRFNAASPLKPLGNRNSGEPAALRRQQLMPPSLARPCGTPGCWTPIFGRSPLLPSKAMWKAHNNSKCYTQPGQAM